MKTAKRIRRRRPFAIARLSAQVLVIALVTISIALMVLSKTSPALVKDLRRSGDVVLAPVLRTVSIPLEFMSKVGDDIGSYFNVRNRNLALEKQMQGYQQLESSFARLQSENQRLRRRLHVTDWPAELIATGRVIGSGGGPFLRSVLINAGVRAGVRSEAAAVDANGVIGQVITAGPVSSRILLLTDINSRIPVRVARTGDTAILVGTNLGEPEVRFLPLNADISVGDQIVTSGHGGVFPPDLGIGEIVYIDNDLIRLETYADLGRLDLVTILEVPQSAFEPVQSDEIDAPAVVISEQE